MNKEKEEKELNLAILMKQAMESNGYLITISYQDKEKLKDKDDLHHFTFTNNFPRMSLLPSLDAIGKILEKEIND